MIRCAKCDKIRDNTNLYNKICGIHMGVCKKCWDGKFILEEKIKK
jgi:hypothetical protein